MKQDITYYQQKLAKITKWLETQPQVNSAKRKAEREYQKIVNIIANWSDKEHIIKEKRVMLQKKPRRFQEKGKWQAKKRKIVSKPDTIKTLGTIAYFYKKSKENTKEIQIATPTELPISNEIHIMPKYPKNNIPYWLFKNLWMQAYYKGNNDYATLNELPWYAKKGKYHLFNNTYPHKKFNTGTL